MVANSREQVISAITSWQSDTPSLLLGLDGQHYSGKTCLAKHIQSSMPSHVVNLDNYLIRQQDSYVASLRIDEICQDIESARHNHPLTVVEGVCLLDVAERCALQFDRVIYVKVTNERLRWMEQEGVEEKVDTASLDPLGREVHLYTLKYRPQGRADLVYERYES